ncbi:MAG: transposase [Pirellulales bacterium]|nr:transposase [Pirellulales bacterium]
MFVGSISSCRKNAHSHPRCPYNSRHVPRSRRRSTLRWDYNHERPHRSLGRRTPYEFAILQGRASPALQSPVD